MALVMLGTLFRVKPKIQGRQQWPMLSLNDLLTAWAHPLPCRSLAVEHLPDRLAKCHRLRQDIKESHARRSMATLESI